MLGSNSSGVLTLRKRYWRLEEKRDLPPRPSLGAGRGPPAGRRAGTEKHRADGKNWKGIVTPPSRVFAYEWQGKDLRDRECIRVASKGLTERPFCASVQGTSFRRGAPTPGVLQKEAGFA